MQEIEKTGIKEIDEKLEKLNSAIGDYRQAEKDLKQTVENANLNCNECENIWTDDCRTCEFAGYKISFKKRDS